MNDLLKSSGIKLVDAVMKSNVIFHKYEIHNDIEWIKKNRHTIEEKYREVKIGEKVKCTIYETQNYFLTMPYYNTSIEDGYHCCVCIDDVQLIN